MNLYLVAKAKLKNTQQSLKKTEKGSARENKKMYCIKYALLPYKEHRKRKENGKPEYCRVQSKKQFARLIITNTLTYLKSESSLSLWHIQHVLGSVSFERTCITSVFIVRSN